MGTAKQQLIESKKLSQFCKSTLKTTYENTDDSVYIAVIHILDLYFFIINKNPGILELINRKVHNYLVTS